MPYVSVKGARLYLETGDIEAELRWIANRLDEIYDLQVDPNALDTLDEERMLTSRSEVLSAELKARHAQEALAEEQAKRMYLPNHRYDHRWFVYFGEAALRMRQEDAHKETSARFALDPKEFDLDNFTRSYRRWCRERVKRR